MTRTRSRRVDAAVALAFVLGSAAGLHVVAEPLAWSAPAPATYLDRLSGVLSIEADRPVAGQPTMLHNGLRPWLRFTAMPLRPSGWSRETARGARDARTEPVRFGAHVRGPPASPFDR